MLKKQAKKITKKIMILTLATSLVFTSCFSYKKLEVKAASVAAGLGAYTLYELCLYIGGLAVTTLGIGYAYENRDEIAEFGKSVIDSMSSLPTQGWILGSHTTNGNYVYGTEALQEVQNTEWTVIQGGGNSPQNDNDGDGDKDKDDINHTINLNGYFLLEKGVELFQNHIKPLYDSWVNKDENSVLSNKYGAIDKYFYDYGVFNGYEMTEDGKYTGYFSLKRYVDQPHEQHYYYEIISDYPIVLEHPFDYDNSSGYSTFYFRYSTYGTSIYKNGKKGSYFNDGVYIPELLSGEYKIETNLPIIKDSSYLKDFNQYLRYDPEGIINASKVYQVGDWIAEDEEWKGYLEDIATSLRSLQDLTAIAQALSEGALTTQPSADEYGDMMVNLGNEYAPKTDPISEPTYYPATNPTPKLDPSVFPNYVPSSNPDVGGGTDEPDNPDDGGNNGNDEDLEIDLPSFSILFNIIYLAVMILVMLLYVFISCLAFIVMIFRIPASSSMLPADMILGFEHLKTIMIPGMNISIYGFAMALIYMLIVFTVIKILRLEINDYGVPRSRKKGG